MSGLFEHEADEGDNVEICEGVGIALVILDEAAEARGPGEGAFHDPASRQQDEAALGLRAFDDLQFDAVRAGGLGRLLTGVAPVGRGQIDAVPGGGLHGLGQPLDPGRDRRHRRV